MILQIEMIENKVYQFDMAKIVDYHIDMKPYRFVVTFNDGTSAVFNMRYVLTLKHLRRRENGKETIL